MSFVAKVTMEDLVRYTLLHKRIPKVVAEFRKITVGGAISGASLESTSHKFGQFMDTVVWIKAKKGDGSIVTVHRDDTDDGKRNIADSLLWSSLSGSFGTMGIVLEAAVECIPVPYDNPHVQVSYHCFSSITPAVNHLLKTAKEEEDDDDEEGRDHASFLEGLDFPPEQVRAPRRLPTKSTSETATTSAMNHRGDGVVVTMQGKIYEPSSAGHMWKSQICGGSFYYEHVRDLVSEHLSKASRNVYSDYNNPSRTNPPQPFLMESIPLEDFLFRYDNGAFWMARPLAFEWSKFLSYFPFTIGMFIASHQLVRFITGWLFTTAMLFKALTSAPQAIIASRMIVQDFYMPAPERAIEMVQKVRNDIPELTTPIWLCPVRANSNQPFTPSYRPPSTTPRPNKGTTTVTPTTAKSQPLLINCGVYGRVADGRGRQYTKELEDFCQSVGGRKMLYAQNFYTVDTFWEIHNKDEYDHRREVHDAVDAFPGMFEKTCTVLPPSQDGGNIWESILSWIL